MTFHLRIGAKFSAASGVGILLVAGMLAVQQFSNNAIERSSGTVARQHDILEDVQAAQAEIKGVQIAYRAIRMADSAQALDTAVTALAGAGDQARTRLDRAVRSAAGATRERLQGITSSLDAHIADVRQIGDLQRALIAGQTGQMAAADDWHKAWKELSYSSAFAALPNRADIEFFLLQGDAMANDIRALFWRYRATSDKRLIARKTEAMTELKGALDQVRTMVTHKAVVALLDRLDNAAQRLGGTFDGSVKTIQAQDLALEKSAALRAELETLAEEVITRTKADSREAETAAANALARIGGIGLAIGAFVIAVMLGTAILAAVSIARPVGRIASVLRSLADGRKDVEIPYLGRGDEVGDAARAADSFRDNIARLETMEADRRLDEARLASERTAREEREAENRRAADEHAAAERRAAMHQLAQDFEAAVGAVIENVSNSSAELESAANMLTETARTTQQLSTVVASASGEASSNVQLVAQAADRMTGAMGEISGRVRESTDIAGEAVAQAHQTDARILELSQAAARIGDVIRLITAIAEQTNLLALNATIEAARAGEAGRGFAVVAQEVKALAAQTAKATGEIGTQIAGMQAATEDSVKAMKEIGGTIARISHIAAAITTAVQEQAAATQEITRNAREAAKGTAQVAANIATVNSGADETGTASARVLGSARSLTSESTRLKRDLQEFLSTVRGH